jgi:hypothetical protein
MPYNEGLLNTYSAPAGTDMSGKQFYGMALVADPGNPPGVHLAVGVAGEAICGVLQNNPLQGQAGSYQADGITKIAISPSQTIPAGGFLDLDVGGTFVLHAAGIIVAQAMEPVVSAASIMITSARLMPGNAATA